MAFLVPVALAATAAALVTSSLAQAKAGKIIGETQESAMQQQAASQAETQRQMAEMEAKSKTSAEELKMSAAQSEEEARKEELRKRAKRTKTLLTGPQGVLGEAETGKKVLLGG